MAVSVSNLSPSEINQRHLQWLLKHRPDVHLNNPDEYLLQYFGSTPSVRRTINVAEVIEELQHYTRMIEIELEQMKRERKETSDMVEALLKRLIVK